MPEVSTSVTSSPGWHSDLIDEADLAEITARMDARAWLQTLDELVSRSAAPGALLDAVADDSRFAWKVFLATNDSDSLLDLDCQFGTSTGGLAAGFGNVVAVSRSQEAAAFTRSRVRAGTAGGRVSVAVADPGARLPLASGTFDCVTATALGIFTRRGENPTANDRDEHSADVLREIHRVLKRDGELFLRCDNALDLRELLSGDDTDDSSAGGTARGPLSRLGTQLLRRSGPGRHLHTLAGYRRLLQKAGFSHIETIAIYRDDNESEELRPVSAGLPAWQEASSAGLKNRLKKSPWLAAGFGFLARKEPAHGVRKIGYIVAQVAAALGQGPTGFRAHRYMASPKGKLIVHASCGATALYLRMPLNSQAEQAESQNHQRLGWLQANRASLAELFPRPVASGSFQEQSYYCESAVHGAPLIDLLKSQRCHKQSLAIGLEFLDRLNPAATSRAAILGEEDYRRLVDGPADALASLAPADDVQRLRDLFAEKLRRRHLVQGLMHGDYGARNILTDGARVSGLLDWEGSDESGIPALDAICLVFSCFSRLGADFRGTESLLDMARRADNFTEFLPQLDDYYTAAGVDPQDHEALVLLYWLHVVAHRLELGRTVPSSDYGRMIQRMITRLLSDSNLQENH